MSSRRLSLILWSALPAAFIGPGTVTTCAKAGHQFGFALLWTLTFSFVACVALQEAVARVTIVSGKDLGGVLRERFARGPLRVVPAVIGGAIILGCAAYQSGNILGAVAGIRLLFDVDARVATAALGAITFALLWFGRTKDVAGVLAALVALMGVAFLGAAAFLRPDPVGLLKGAIVPAIPAGSAQLVLGLVGTTVVPYNLFLGSGLARHQKLEGLRGALAWTIGVGVAISMGIVIVGTSMQGSFDYETLAHALDERLTGRAGHVLLGLGLFGAGFSSAITAPLAAAMTAQGVFGSGEPRATAPLQRITWIAVLLFGCAFGLANAKPIPVILLAQAANGIVLPFAAVVLFLLMRDRRTSAPTKPVEAWILGLVVLVTVLLGAFGVVQALSA